MQGASWLAGLCFLLFAGTVQALELGKQRSDYQASPDLRWLEAKGYVSLTGQNVVIDGGFTRVG